MLDELGVAVGRLARMRGEIFLPQQLQGHALASQLAVDAQHIGQHSLTARLVRRRRCKQGGRQRGLVHGHQRRPVQPGHPRRRDVLANHALGQLQGTGNLLVGQAGLKLEAQTFFDVSHGYSRRRHLPLPKSVEDGGASGHAQRRGRLSLSRDRRFR
ncbi:hypothetical protein CD30_19530 [Ureibacillus massiliensis 4400831 = CIP 108448 = CCUG 49529]|uniref:Uncharacterized protein n=5 Tax=Bacteria TaxID=2 RepID=A0A0A3I6B4_9BACL|nr:hypothetical protein CD29_20035 [Ureibacillus manganicus DSM 26584]KGR80301.1 hypothetical protein CD33_00185 [Ureibacillus sinduriensis BLB-1 = JCM 15800]KGR81078.1 hypothetical protein CD30_19530 [Ureibacillus massiliensis 4400831 = CIP 108448 = CCUG 49529]KGX84108.1 hypothetical protein N784_14615 [Pontibacillus litoralis JSM 072002]